MTRKKNLRLELGEKYVNEFFHNALFMHDGKLCKLRLVEGTSTTVHFVDPKNPAEQWQELVIPTDTLKDFSTFQWPTLGYRQWDTEHGKVVVHATALRTAHRGLRFENLHFGHLPVVQRLLPLRGKFDRTSAPRILGQLFAPTFTPFTEGLKELIAGQTSCFAVNPHLAVCVSLDQSADTHYDIYYRQKIVGSVSETGEVTLTNKVVQRDNVRTALFG